jgi:hypothetical protein
MVFYIIAATERASNSGQINQKIAYKSEEQIKNKIKQTRPFQGANASELHDIKVSEFSEPHLRANSATKRSSKLAIWTLSCK